MSAPTRHCQLTQLGGSKGVTVSRMGLGTTALGGMFHPVRENEVRAVLDEALTAGIRHIDTAPLYGHGRAERLIGSYLRTRHIPEGVMISTKVGRRLAPNPVHRETVFHGADPNEVIIDFREGIRTEYYASLRRLRQDYVKIALLHDPEENAEEAFSHGFPALQCLRDEGLVQAIGVGTKDATIAAEAIQRYELDVVLLAGRYTLLDQSARHTLLPAAQREGVSVIAAGVYNSGVLLDPDHGHYEYSEAPSHVRAQVHRLHEIITSHGVSVTAAALQFPFRHPSVVSVLVGPRSVTELRESITAFNSQIPDALWDELCVEGLT